MGEKLGKIIKDEPNPNQYPPPQPYPPQQIPPQQPYPQQPMGYPPQYQQQPQYNYPPMPPARPMIQGDLLKMEKITQDKKDWIVIDIVIEEKFAQGLRIGKIFVMQ